MIWSVKIKKRQLKKLDNLPLKIRDLFTFLERDLKLNGPEQPSWKNYSKLGKTKYHCHLNYRYVACWTAAKETITIEVYYVGSRE